jgi:L-cystine uptake protein TcyP (sodium:dicarboxylate symporter family)
MKMWVINLVNVIVIVVLIYMYDKLVANKSLNKGLLFGLLYGIATGVSMGYGTYSVQPIPYHMALIWFLGSAVRATVAGLWLGLFVKDE